MDELVYKSKVIDAIDKKYSEIARTRFWNFPTKEEASLYNALKNSVSELSPVRFDNGCTDTISRQSIIDLFYQHPNVKWTTLDVLEMINSLQPAQPTKENGNTK